MNIKEKMSNFREIDGIFINLDLVESIMYDKKQNGKYTIRLNVQEFFEQQRSPAYYNGTVEYDTEEQAKKRIREIIFEQTDYFCVNGVRVWEKPKPQEPINK